MLSKFSVKKPYTVFVAIIAILVLGVVSFLNLTPDLLPNIDFPYVIITVILILLGFIEFIILVFAFIWAILGGIGMLFKYYDDVDKKKKKWRESHPDDPAGGYL